MMASSSAVGMLVGSDGQQDTTGPARMQGRHAEEGRGLDSKDGKAGRSLETRRAYALNESPARGLLTGGKMLSCHYGDKRGRGCCVLIGERRAIFRAGNAGMLMMADAVRWRCFWMVMTAIR